MAAKKATAKRAKPAKATTRRATTAKRATSRKPAVKKATATKKAPKAKAVAAKKPAKAAVKAPVSLGPIKVSETFTKTQLHSVIADATGLSKKDVANVFECLANVVEGHINKRGTQLFTLPGLLKIKVIRKPATKARKGINPFTGEETMFKAKPARNVVKVQALKKLKEMAA